MSLSRVSDLPSALKHQAQPGVLAENLIRPIRTLFAVANGSGMLPVGRGMD